jgi:hypothetical protein
MKKTADPELERVIDKPLQLRIEDFRRELETYVNEYAEQIKRSSAGAGLPIQSILQMLMGGSQCRCAVALKILSDQKRDKEIEHRQQRQESAA